VPQFLKKPVIDAMPDIVLTGARLTARVARREDGPDWLAARRKNRDALEPFEPAWPPDALSAAHFQRRLERQTADWRMGRAQPFIIRLTDGALIGGININNITRGAAQFASLGYWLDADHQGQGYMAEAVRLIIAYAFDELKLHRLNAGCLAHNTRSRNLLLKLGFAEEGFAEKYLEINGAWQDHVLFGLPVERHLKK
jgi:ribosomal-protein-alanine N-acetyltransferase